MHPDIKKFWEQSGYEIAKNATVVAITDDTRWREVYFLKKDGIFLTYAALSEIVIGKVFPSNFRYYMLDTSKSFSEAEILRRIRMKAFW